MKAENKAFIKTFLVAGIVYASIMAGFDYADGQEFKPYKFLFSFLFFGLFMGYIFRNGHKKQLKKEVMETEIKTTETKSPRWRERPARATIPKSKKHQ